jgi:pyruvate/2-oxoacid:ferredoxin oxidoreductase alpha subunit
MKKHTDLDAQGNYIIRKAQMYKGYVFLLSVFEANAYWTAHEYAGDHRAPVGVLRDLFQTAHNKQVDFLRKQAAENEMPEFKEETIDDHTQIHIPGLKNNKP